MDMNVLLTELLKIVIFIIITGLGIILKKYAIPALKKSLDSKNIVITKEQLEIIKSIITDFVNSAYRLGITNKVTDLKKYVMDNAKVELGKLGIEVSDELLDEIRRAAVVELEKSIKELENTIVTDKTEEKKDEIKGE